MGQPATRPPDEHAGADLGETEREVARGAAPATPFYALGGVALVVAIVFVVALAIAVIAWLVAR